MRISRRPRLNNSRWRARKKGRRSTGRYWARSRSTPGCTSPIPEGWEGFFADYREPPPGHDHNTCAHILLCVCVCFFSPKKQQQYTTERVLEINTNWICILNSLYYIISVRTYDCIRSIKLLPQNTETVLLFAVVACPDDRRINYYLVYYNRILGLHNIIDQFFSSSYLLYLLVFYVFLPWHRDKLAKVTVAFRRFQNRGLGNLSAGFHNSWLNCCCNIIIYGLLRLIFNHRSCRLWRENV